MEPQYQDNVNLDEMLTVISELKNVAHCWQCHQDKQEERAKTGGARPDYTITDKVNLHNMIQIVLSIICISDTWQH